MTELVEPSPRLGRRQRAMLKEMGIHVWQPLPVVPAAEVQAPALPPTTINSGAARSHITKATGTFDVQKPSLQAPKLTLGPEVVSSSASAWRVGNLQTLYADIAAPQAARWLILIESPASALEGNFKPFEGDVGKLLDNMLRAAKLHLAITLLAPLVRAQRTDLNSAPSVDLADTFASAKADMVLVMGRLAAQALLQSTEPLAKLRGQVHTLHNTAAIITLEPTYLLRHPLEKAKAWDDLCLALSVVNAVG